MAIFVNMNRTEQLKHEPKDEDDGEDSRAHRPYVIHRRGLSDSQKYVGRLTMSVVFQSLKHLQPGCAKSEADSAMETGMWCAQRRRR